MKENISSGNKTKKTNTPRMILVVEDDKGLSRLIQKHLQREGFQTEGAINGADAISFVVNNKNIVMLLDYRLPDMSGKRVIETLTERQCMVPFIIMTGHGDVTIAVEMMKLGARDYLLKDSDFLDILPSVVNRVADQLEIEKRLNT
ncbi:MAG: response regulator, partial [Deltaproteobacteria bacterium]|nr:response regulator [Deltaproteobacteria bacterium]